MKKILLASNYSKIKHMLQLAFNQAGLEAEIIRVNSTEAIIQELCTGTINYVITEYTVDAFNIWKLATLIQSPRLVGKPVPLILLKNSYSNEIPALLAKEYQFCVLDLTEIPTALERTFDFRPSLLIIEDDYYAADSAYHALKQLFSITVRYDGETGLDAWLEKKHDIVLLDLMLPDLQGDEVLKRILSVNITQSVIMLTAFSSLDNHKMATLEGACAFLGKPYNIDELRYTCQRAVNKATLFCLSFYKEQKLNILGNKLFLLDYNHVNQNKERYQVILAEMQDLLSNHMPTEDEQARLLRLELEL